MNEHKIFSSADMMMNFGLFNSLESDKITTTWKKVVSKIHSNKYESEDSERRMPIGERLAGNTRVIDLKNGVLLIEADHSGWIQYLRFYKNFILRGLKQELPDFKINSLAFRVRGTVANLSNAYEDELEKQNQKMEEKMNRMEKELNVNVEKNSRNFELPPEIQQKFENLKKSMLTNIEK